MGALQQLLMHLGGSDAIADATDVDANDANDPVSILITSAEEPKAEDEGKIAFPGSGGKIFQVGSTNP